MRGHAKKDKVQTQKDGQCDVTEVHWSPEYLDENFHEIHKSLWHVFESLRTSGTTVKKTRLKVLAANIGQQLGFAKGEEILDETESKELDFDEFYSLLQTQMFDKLKANSNVNNAPIDFETVHSVCWMLCCNKLYSNKESGPVHIKENDVYYIWRIFNFLAEADENDNPLHPLVLDPDEVKYVCNVFIQLTGQCNKEEVVKTVGDGQEPFSFQSFQTLFLDLLISQLDEDEKSSGLKELFSTFVLDVIKKGKVSKKGHQVKNWKDRWIVLTSAAIDYYSTPEEKEKKGSIKMEKNCRLETLTDKQKHNKFIIHTTVKPYEILTADVKTRNEWVSAIQKVIDNCDSQIHFQRQAARARRENRRNRRKKADDDARRRREESELMAKGQRELEEERLRHLQDSELLEKHRIELEAERKARAEAEARLQEEAALREAEQKRLKELEEIKNELERLLEQERQAKRDEEIVRALQARILEEEFQKREELEKLKNQQEELLKNERLKREGLEGQQEEQEQLLREAQTKLDELEREGRAASYKLQEAADKLKQAEKERTRLEEKVKLWRTPTVGLARPVLPKVDPLVTHRGKGAFCKSDFAKRKTSESDQSDEASGVARLRLNSDYSTQSTDSADNGFQDQVNEEEENALNMDEMMNNEVN